MRRIFLIFFLSIYMLVGCSIDSTYDIVQGSLSEVRVSLAKGYRDGVVATLMCGYRECEYVYDGVCTESVEFGVLTFSIDGFDKYDYGEPTYVLNVGMERYSGVLELNPFDSTLVADVGKVMNIQENVVAYLHINGARYDIYLNPVSSEWQIDSDSVLHIFVDKYKDTLREYIQGDSISGETYVKMVYDDTLDEYYWYVNFITTQGSTISMIVDKDTGHVLVDKINIL